MSSSIRYNTYSKIHRGLRAAMADTLTTVGRTDPADEAQVASTLADVEALLQLCDGHLELEDRFIHAAMEARRPGSAHKTTADHQHHLESMAALRREIGRVRNWQEACRAHRLEALYQQLSAFVAENFEHMLVEESYNNAVLWDCYTDAEILDIEHALVASMPPEKNARVLAIIVPAISAPEREELLGRIRAAAPREIFDGLLAMLAPRIPEPERARLGTAMA